MTISRRDMLRITSAGAVGTALSGWFRPFASFAAETPRQNRRIRSCVLLWMDGGPSHIDTFDPKPDAAADVRGPYQSIQTPTTGIRISEGFTRFSRHMNDAVLLRGMSTADNNHITARNLMHTGYRLREGGLNYPSLGHVVAHELGRDDASLPNFVITGMSVPYNPRRSFLTDPGYLGPRYSPLVIEDPDRGVDNIQAHLSQAELDDRLATLRALEANHSATRESALAVAQRTTQQRAVELMRSAAGQAFNLSRETPATRDRYGSGHFSKSILLARRLVEVGVPFIEVDVPEWDTHTGARAANIKNDVLPQVDRALDALITDLKDRGLFDSTLIVWMGEFGRSPKVRPDGGRDHYARAWSTMMCGGGIRGGQVIGRTDATGATVVDRPISTPDFFATLCLALGIDVNGEMHAPGNRPVRIVKRGANPIGQILA